MGYFLLTFVSEPQIGVCGNDKAFTPAQLQENPDWTYLYPCFHLILHNIFGIIHTYRSKNFFQKKYWLFLNISISEYNGHLWSSAFQGVRKAKWEERHPLQDCRLPEGERKDAQERAFLVHKGSKARWRN